MNTAIHISTTKYNSGTKNTLATPRRKEALKTIETGSSTVDSLSRFCVNITNNKLMAIKMLIEVKRGNAETKMTYTANPEVLFTPIRSYSLNI
jgi:hypothetical protein